MEETFPHRPVRGVSVRYGTVANCFPDFVSFSLDFEPLADGRAGYEFVSDLDYGFDEYSHELHAECAPAISQGVLLNLSGAPQSPNQLTVDVDTGSLPVGRLDNTEGGPLLAVRVVLTRVRYHLVDSASATHRYAGWRAAHKARCALFGTTPDPDHKDWTTAVPGTS
ncbi:hypothetical protein [Allokutzneria oryzae]|uniref:Uncharacterized protein n=1 Tax=Allokutzneria oryzae TaxID=1378989 RepID=A0ABV5ZUP9_9PSEU